ncbi:EAL domain-containing protein [Bacillus sp. B1-b2]|uniref:EAL domain-containing protein n=1 Tax=Bacillus sp. B1-b2 TaxID=2653201 RepID=UPI0012622AC5|nr:EAL domain-containing protein [Bacillus sp. B1-b2]KAB7668428.1 EAL domain-containing protein [Bacillus sp. B1-b2]
MWSVKRIVGFTFVSTLFIFMGWNILFYDNKWLIALGLNIMQIGAGLFSLYWIWSLVKNKSVKKLFWRFILIGVQFYLLSNFIWLYGQLKFGMINQTIISYSLWFIAYLFFITALLVKIQAVSKKVSIGFQFFYMIIYAITIFSISIDYLIQPLLQSTTGSFFKRLVTLGYPITNIIILFVLSVLYYVTKYSSEKKLMLTISCGFLFQVIADTYLVYSSIHNTFQYGTILDVFWIFSLLFIGYAAVYDRKRESAHQENMVYDRAKEEISIFPYLSIIMLLFLVFTSRWEFNAISLGLSVLLLFIIIYQSFVLNKNEKLRKEYTYIANHDSLTGLKNRISFLEILNHLIRCKKDTNTGILLINLDRFKTVNDSLGHDKGDQILVQAAKRLESFISNGEYLFRIGGDEFVIILSNTTEEYCVEQSKRIVRQFGDPFFLSDCEIMVTTSIGSSIYPENGKSAEELLRNADIAMNYVKETGKNHFQHFHSERMANVKRKLLLEQGLSKAVKENQFFLLYQPKVDLRNRKIISVEALLRWQHPKLGLVSPVEFIPIAEETGQIIAIGNWVLKKACEQIKIWRKNGFMDLTISVNVSVIQLQQDDFIANVQKTLENVSLPTSIIELEITESIMQDIQESTKILSQLRSLGISISIDDFGTGYSSLYILQKLPINSIKIDKAFMENLNDDNQRTILKTMIEMGNNLGLNVIVEGIEEENQINLLLDYHCYLGQGYFFSEPVNAIELEDMLRQNAIGYI